MNKEIKKAAAIAKIAHAGQKYGDADYFEKHISEVAALVFADRWATSDAMIVAYLHDTVEDTSVTLDDLSDLGFAPNIVEAIDAISRRDGENYLSEYIPRVKKNKLAAFVKGHDLAANSNDNTPARLLKRNKKAWSALK